MSYWIYKQFGRVISEKETHASINKWLFPWYLKPYYSFIEWNEKRKRYNQAEIKLKSDNPWSGFLLELFNIIFCVGIISIFSLLAIFTIKGCS